MLPSARHDANITRRGQVLTTGGWFERRRPLTCTAFACCWYALLLFNILLLLCRKPSDSTSRREGSIFFVAFYNSSSKYSCEALTSAAAYDFPVVAIEVSRVAKDDVWNIIGKVADEVQHSNYFENGVSVEDPVVYVFHLDNILFQEPFSPVASLAAIERSRSTPRSTSSHPKVYRQLATGEPESTFPALCGRLSDLLSIHHLRTPFFEDETLFPECADGEVPRTPASTQFCFPDSILAGNDLSTSAFNVLSWGFQKTTAVNKAAKLFPTFFLDICFKGDVQPTGMHVYRIIDRANFPINERGGIYFHDLETKIERINGSAIQTLIREGKVVLPEGLILTDQPVKLSRQRHSFTFEQLAKLYSHIKTLHFAYVSKAEFAVILEGDLVLCKSFTENLSAFLDSAPVMFESIRLISPRDRSATHSKYIAEPITKWFPQSSDTAAYLITRRGISKVLEIYGAHEGSVSNTIKFPSCGHDAEILDINEVISYYTHSFLSTRANVIEKAQRSQQNIVINDAECVQWNSHELFLPQEKVLVFTTLRVLSLSQLGRTLSLLAENRVTLNRYVPKVSWRVFAIVTKLHLFDLVVQQINMVFGEDKHFSVKVSYDPLRYNKFFYLRAVLDELNLFDKILLTDSDMHFAGYAWVDFFRRARSSVVAGSLHRNMNESLSCNSHKVTRQWFKIFDGAWWEVALPDLQAVEIPFIEQAFALLDARFALWYFSMILTDNILYYRGPSGPIPRQSDFGPDVMWCGAAKDWIRQNRARKEHIHPCVLVALSMNHGDDRQIGTQAIDVEDKELLEWLSFVERRPLELYKIAFQTWFTYSKRFIKQVGGKTQHGDKLIKMLRRDAVREKPM